MARRRKPNYFRSLSALWPGFIAGVAVAFIDRIDAVLCSMVPASVACPATLPGWAYVAVALIVFASVAWTCWAWYKDHVRGEYLMDVMHGIDRYRD